MAYDNTYSSLNDNAWDFTADQQTGLADAGRAAAIVSCIANLCVLAVHGFMSRYRPTVVNRLSLRMIVFSCVCNIVYCASQLATDNIPATSHSCRALAYVTTISDTMACMCLAMVGLNLVMIFALKVPKSLKIEVFYYVLVILSGVIVSVIPLTLGTSKGPHNKSEHVSCWYHYYFDGRIHNIFNWMWYYGCLLFSLLFAAICAAISIRFVVKKQRNFTGALDMFTRRNKKDIEAMATLRKYFNRNIDVFHKIALRCILYPLVPLFSKSWGVGIEIAASRNSSIPYAVFILDRLFSCLLGFMVSCIYFTDPAINAVFREFIDSIKCAYVHNYFSVRYYPTATHPVPKLVKVAVMPNYLNGRPELLEQARCRYASQGSIYTHENNKSSNRPQGSKVPSMKLLLIHGAPAAKCSSDDRQYVITAVISKDGQMFLPNEDELNSTSVDSKRYKDIPMHSLIDDLTLSSSKKMTTGDASIEHHNVSIYLNQQENIETLKAFRFSALAKVIHWSLIHLFRVSPHDDEPHIKKAEAKH